MGDAIKDYKEHGINEVINWYVIDDDALDILQQYVSNVEVERKKIKKAFEMIIKATEESGNEQFKLDKCYALVVKKLEEL